jgi:drug/metabolite transporter (DMT)-like permease
MLLTMVFWGVSFVASKLVLTQITPLTYMGVRFAAASLLLAIVMAVRGRPRFSGRTHWLIALTALAEPVAYFLFESFGIRLITATTASLIIATIPLAVMVLAAIFLGEPVNRRGLVAVFVSISGIVLLVVGDPASATAGANQTLGILLVVGAVFSAAFYITLARNLTQRHDPVNLTVVQTWWGAGVFIALWRVQTPAARSLTTLTPVGWIAIVFLVVCATVGAFMLYNWALRHEEAGRASLYINAIPVVTAFTGWLLLDERLALLQWIGGIMVLVSVRISGGGRGAASVTQVAETVPPEA